MEVSVDLLASSMIWSCLIFQLLLLPTCSSYEAISPPASSVSYSQSTASGTVRIFPNETIIRREDYGYFFNELNFNINSRLLTGAADNLYLFDLDLNIQSSFSWPPSLSDLTSCYQTNDNSSYTCRNHIRIFKQLPSNSSQLFVCGTQADTTPQCRIVEFASGEIGRGFMTDTASDGLLSYFPEYSSFGEFVPETNTGDDRFFSAAFGSTDRDFRISVTNVSLTTPTDPSTLQTSELFRTFINDRWLNFPVTFVDYFRADYTSSPPENYQFYFVFLREKLTDTDVIHSRVARICRNDPGIVSSLQSHFTSFMKARIFCEREVPPGRQFAGSLDYQYNEIRSVVFNGEGRYGQTTDWLKLMYGAFAGPSIGPIGTAICVYRADNSIERGETGFNRGIFDIFREDLQNSEGGEVENRFVECSSSGRTVMESELVQVVQDVSQIGESPLLVLDGIIVTQMVVDQVCVVRSSGTGCVNQDVLFLGTDTGKILKVIFIGSTADTSPVLAEEITLDDNNAVNQLNLRTVNSSSKYIFASTFSKIYRLPLDRCTRHNDPNNVTDSCRSCIESRDPYCLWNIGSRVCESNTLSAVGDATVANTDNFLQNVHTDEVPQQCTFPEIGFTLATASVNESENTFTVTIRSSVSGSASNGLVRIYTSNEGTASAGMDYTALSESGEPVIFSPGSTEAMYTISLSPDDRFEGGNEQFTVVLRPESDVGVVISQSQLTINIIEDDAVSMRFESMEVSASEGDCVVNVTIEMDGESTVDSRVFVRTAQVGSAVVGEDYRHVDTELTFLFGETQKTVSIPLINDNVQELDKWFAAEIYIPAEQVGVILGTPAVTNITIMDDDSVEIEFLERDVVVNEGDRAVQLTLVKSGEAVRNYEVELRLFSGTAGAADYDNSMQRITFAANEGNQKTVTITIMDDDILENLESFSVELTVPSGLQQDGLIASSSATVTILDDDNATVGFSSTDYSTSEGDGSITVNVELSVATEIEVIVELIKTVGTASNDDFDSNPVRLTFVPSGSTSQPVVIQIQNDDRLESDEYFIAQLISTSPRVSAGQATANLTIMDDDAVTVEFAPTEYTASEGVYFIAVGIRLTGTTEIPLTFYVSTVSQTAVSGEDFVALQRTSVVFSPLSDSAELRVEILNDERVEGTEMFQVSIERAGTPARVVIGRDTANITLEDDDFVEFGFESLVYTISEGGLGTVEVAVIKYGISTLPLSVMLSTISASASAPGDYTEVNGHTLTFSPEERRQTLSITIIDDAVLEDTEQFFISMTQSDPRAEVMETQNVTTVTVMDNDVATVGFSSTDYSTSEGDGSIAVNVELSVATEIEVIVELIKTVGTASNNDFDSDPVRLTFVPSGSTSQPVVIQIQDDDRLESDEYFIIQLISTSPRVSAGQAGANLTIMDDDTLTVELAAANYTASERVYFITVGVRLTGTAEIPLTFYISTVNQTAVSGEDFVALQRTSVVFSPLSDSAELRVEILNDERVEGTEMFQVSIERTGIPARVVIGRDTANITLEDDDFVEFGFESLVYTIFEGGMGAVEVAVTKYGVSTLPLSVMLSTISASASAPGDYTEVNGHTLTFSPEERRQTLSITIIDDTVLEDTEQFSVSMTQSDQRAQVMETQNMTTVMIIDNDVVMVNFSPLEYRVVEGDQSVTVNVIVGETESTVNVSVKTVPATALAGVDYVSNQTTLTFSSGVSQAVRISVINDNIFEDTEYFTVELSTSDPKVLLLQNRANVSIIDDDTIKVRFGSPTYTASEMDCFVAVDIQVNGISDVPFIVNLTTISSARAVAGQDFVHVSKMPLTIGPRISPSQVNIQLVNDEAEMDVESFTVLLEPNGDGVSQRITVVENTTTIFIQDDDRVPTTERRVDDRTDDTQVNIPGIGSLADRCIYDSFTTSAAVLAVLLAVIAILLALLMVCACVLASKIRNERKLVYQVTGDLSLGSGSKRPSPDRLPMENFGIPNKVYCENSQPNTPVTLKRTDDGSDAATMLWNNNHNNGNVGGNVTEKSVKKKDSEQSSSSEDLTMTQL